MAVYKFKVYFEDEDDVYRIIEVKSNQTFEHMHLAILNSVGFDSKHQASFYKSDDLWKKGQEITTRDTGGAIPLMGKSKLSSFINDPHQKFLYIYDFDREWIFHVELTGISIKEDLVVDYPHVVKSVGKPPKQYPAADKKGNEEAEEDEFSYITRNLLAGDVSEEELAEHNNFGDDEDEDSEGDDEMGGEEEAIADDDDV